MNSFINIKECHNCGKIFVGEQIKIEKCDFCQVQLIDGLSIQNNPKDIANREQYIYSKYIKNNQDKLLLYNKRNNVSISENTNNNPLPKCPTCGSTNIRRISGTERAANIFAFGLLGNKRKCQFECQNPNCRYRW